MPGQSLIQRVARELREICFEHALPVRSDADYLRDAKRLIMAMRSCTEAMADAGSAAGGHRPEDIWRGMIDAAAQE